MKYSRDQQTYAIAIGVNTGGDAGDAPPPQKSQCGGRQCYSSPPDFDLKNGKI